MRLMIASLRGSLGLAILTSLGLATSACGKKQEAPKPEPTKAATVEPTKAPEPTPTPTEPTKAPEPTQAAEADVTEAPADDAAVVAADDAAVAPVEVDRVAETMKSVEAYAAGKFEESFANLADNVEWTELGNPMAQAALVGKQAVIDFHKKLGEGFTETKMKPARIIVAGDTVAVQAVWSGKNTGAMQGKEATNKEASFGVAYVVHYGADGKIDKGWAVSDSMLMLGQLGLMPNGAPLEAMPEETEIVKIEAKAGNADGYKANTEKLNAATVEEVLTASATETFEHWNRMSGTLTKGRAENIAAMKKSMSESPDFAVKVDAVWAAGDWVVAAQTVSFTYKGGIDGVEAKDQKVSVPMLAFAEMTDGKLASYRDYANGLTVLAQLGVPMGGAAEKPADAPAADGALTVGVPACDKFIAAYAACVEAMPEAARGPAKGALGQMAKGWKEAIETGGEAAKTGLESGCKQAWESTKGTMGAACPSVKWE